MNKRNWGGGARVGAGRPKIGDSRPVKLTLHPSVWAAIEHEMEGTGAKLPELVRSIVTGYYWDKMELMGLELPHYKGSVGQ